MKKLLAILLAVIMVCSLSITAFAANNPVISVPTSDDHTYDVFQIFTGDLSEDGTTLSNVKWGANAILPSGAKVGDAVPESVLNELAAVASSTSDSAKLDVINKYVDLTSEVFATIDSENSKEAITGYYLIKDTSAFTPETDGDGNELETYSLYIVELVADVNISRKATSIPTDDKVINEDDGVKVNQVHIGDYVPYKVTANVPGDIANYDYYYFMITDKMSKGLTLTIGKDNKEVDHPFTVKAVKSGETDKTLGENDYTLLTGDATAAVGDYDFVVALKDAKSLAGWTIVVTFEALVNDEATVVKEPNTNKEHVIYSDNPNHKYGGETNPDGVPDEIDEKVFGETPDKTVDSWSTALTIHKVDEKGNILTGAEFTLSGSTNRVRVVTETVFEEDEKGTYYKLKDGKYTETKPTQDRMEQADDNAEKGFVIAEEGFTGETKTVNNVVYRAYVKDNDSGKTVYVLVNGTENLYESTSTMYKKTTKSTTMMEDTDKANIAKMVDEKDGTATFEGIAVGSYKIEETVTPDGFNTIAPIEFSVTFDPTNHTFASSNPNVILATDNGLEVTIVNQSGTELPETGGIGTTIFYVLGGILLVGAAVLLITKKKMSNEG